MRTDSDIKRDVEAELQSDPSIDATDIAVAVKNGVVTLSGFVRSYAEKLEAEAAAKRIASVVGLANDLEVRVPAADQRPDPEIARDAVTALKSQLPFSWHQIKVIVDKPRPGVLPHLVSREPEQAWTAGQWMTEQQGGSDVGANSVEARRDGAGWRLHGRKYFCSNVGGEVVLGLARPEAGAVYGAMDMPWAKLVGRSRRPTASKRCAGRLASSVTWRR